jgi:hypothetical protein
MLRHSADTNEALQRLEDLHRRVLRSQRLKLKLQETTDQPLFDESPPYPLTRKRINDINSSHSHCQRDVAVDLHLQPLAHGHACVLSTASISERIGHWEKILSGYEKNASALAKKMCLGNKGADFLPIGLDRQRRTRRSPPWRFRLVAHSLSFVLGRRSIR